MSEPTEDPSTHKTKCCDAWVKDKDVYDNGDGIVRVQECPNCHDPAHIYTYVAWKDRD